MGVATRKGAIFAEIEQTFGQVPGWVQATPEPALEGFWTLMRDFYLAETQIPNKYKELIGLAVSGATRCRYCQLFHTEGARLAGATDEEIREAAMMSGVTMLSSTFVNALGIDFEDFELETRQIISYVKQQQQKQASSSSKKPAPHARV